jgi:hypothetical protein
MRTLYSVAIAGAIFTAFLALGMTNSLAGTTNPEGRAEMNCPGVNSGFVHDKETIRLFLLYHNPSHGGVSAATPVPGRPIALSI